MINKNPHYESLDDEALDEVDKAYNEAMNKKKAKKKRTKSKPKRQDLFRRKIQTLPDGRKIRRRTNEPILQRSANCPVCNFRFTTSRKDRIFCTKICSRVYHGKQEMRFLDLRQFPGKKTNLLAPEIYDPYWNLPLKGVAPIKLPKIHSRAYEWLLWEMMTPEERERYDREFEQ